MKTFPKVMLGGCLTLVGLFALLLISYAVHRARMSPEERAAEDKRFQEQADARRKQREKEEADRKAAEEVKKEKVRRAQQEGGRPAAEALVRKLTLMRRQLPRPSELAEKPCPASLKGEQVTYLPADYVFFTQFAETGFKPLENPDPKLWYRGASLEQAEKALVAGKTPAEWDMPALAQVSASFDAQSYLAVFLPLNQRWPELHQEKKTFSSGVYQGWVILVDARKQEPLCQTKFEAFSSDKVTDRYLSIGPRDPEHSLKIGANLSKAVADDFTENFWKAANQAIGRMRKQGETQ